jgi:enterochelin esterase-like enzyme
MKLVYFFVGGIEMIPKERRGSVIDDSVYSQHLDRDIPLIIYLPYNYSPLYTYPTLYLQDGEDYFTLGKIASTLDRLIDEQSIEKCIIVGVPVESKRERLVLYRSKGSKHEAYKRFFAEELVPYIDTTYDTHPMSGARAIMGDSLGGSVSLDIALQYPYTFHHVASQSGAFYEGTIERIKAFQQPPSLLSIYQIVGTEETHVETSVGQMDLLHFNREVKEAFEKKGIPLIYSEFKGDHTWGYWQEDISRVLNHLWGKET